MQNTSHVMENCMHEEEKARSDTDNNGLVPKTPQVRARLVPKLWYSRRRLSKEKKFSYIYLSEFAPHSQPLNDFESDVTCESPVPHQDQEQAKKPDEEEGCATQNVVDIGNFPTIQTPIKTETSSKKRKNDGGDSNRRPTKTPKKIHRPKVIGESKRKRPKEVKTPRPTTPKRAYTKRKKPGVKKSESGKDALVVTVSDQADVQRVENGVPSCRRSLNFEAENVSEDRSNVAQAEEGEASKTLVKERKSRRVGGRRSKVQLRDLTLDLKVLVKTKKKRSNRRIPRKAPQLLFIEKERGCESFQVPEAKTDALSIDGAGLRENENLQTDNKAIGFSDDTGRICDAMKPNLFDLNLPCVENETGLVKQSNGVHIPHQECGTNSGVVVPQAEDLPIVAVEQGRGQIAVDKKNRKQLMLKHYEEDVKAWKHEVKRLGYGNTDEEEAREKLESERKMFRNRIKVFTSCMHQILGDRTFSKWKGSVIDSVVGVFLTQNVSDILSSSAFIDLRARFPTKRSNTCKSGHKKRFVGPKRLLHKETKDEVDIEDMAPNRSEEDIEFSDLCLTLEHITKIVGSCSTSEEIVKMMDDVCKSPLPTALESESSNSTKQHPSDKQEAIKHEEEIDSEEVRSETKKTIGNVCESALQLALESESSNSTEQHRSETESAINHEDECRSETIETMDDVSKSAVQTVLECESMNLKEQHRSESKSKAKEEVKTDWEEVRKRYQRSGERRDEHEDSVDWEAVRHAEASVIADSIKKRGQHNNIAKRIKEFLNRVVELHKTLDLEWLRDAPADLVQKYLLEFNGLGLKSVECIRLLAIRNVAFPVDTNVGRIAVRLGWVPLEPLPEELQLHLLQQYPIMDSIQKYLWPRLCTLDQHQLYEPHYHLITFGKVFCTKRNPSCNDCPMKAECRHYASHYASARKALPGPAKKGQSSSWPSPQEAVVHPLPILDANEHLELVQCEAKICEPVIEMPLSPEPEREPSVERGIEDYIFEDDSEAIPTLRLDREPEVLGALVTLAPGVASFPAPKLKSVNRLRTKHLVYELPDSHHLLDRFDKRDPNDPSPYLLTIWAPDETTSSSQDCGKSMSNDETCCSSCIREQNPDTVRVTILIPCRTAMRGRFPLNGTYFQVNEVFADDESSHIPIEIPRESVWNLGRRFVYFGSSTSAIFKGLPVEEIMMNFWTGFMCDRAYDRKTGTTKPLALRLHTLASRQIGSRSRKKETN